MLEGEPLCVKQWYRFTVMNKVMNKHKNTIEVT